MRNKPEQMCGKSQKWPVLFPFFFLPPLLLENESIRQCKQHFFLFRFLHRFCFFFFFKRSSTFLALVLSIFLSHAGECVAASSQLGGGSKRGVCVCASKWVLCDSVWRFVLCVCHKCPCQYFTSFLHAEERVFIWDAIGVMRLDTHTHTHERNVAYYWCRFYMHYSNFGKHLERKTVPEQDLWNFKRWIWRECTV